MRHVIGYVPALRQRIPELMAKITQSTTKRPSQSKYKKTTIGTGRNSRQDKPYKGQGR